MKRALISLAVLVVLASVVTWVATGANRGWTKTSQTIQTRDPVTEIEGSTDQPKFSPGVDFLGAAFAAAGLLAGTSLLFRHKNQTNDKH